MPNIITEDMIEQASIQLLTTEQHYTHINCYTSKRDTLPDGTGRDDKRQVTLPLVLLKCLGSLNLDIPLKTIQTVAEELCQISYSDSVQLNYNNYQKLREGIPVKYKKEGITVHSTLKLIDFATPENNNFIVASQMWIMGKVHWRRPDLIIFVNGLPLVFIELKNSNVNTHTAYTKNLKDYINDIPQLFSYNQICVLSNGIETRLGSFSAGYEHFFEWFKLKDEKENPDRKAIKDKGISLEYFLRGLCQPATLLDYIENFILYDRKGASINKILAKNHQFLGVNNAFQAFENRQELQGKLGVFWHTQGSGKSYSMVMLARKIRRKCTGNFTFLIITDRDDLDKQIYKTFQRCGFMSEHEKCQPTKSNELRKELRTNKGILFSLIQKFRYDKGKKYPLLHDGSGKEVIVFVDEAHRTQYQELGENMRKGLPHAHYLAFTGTPLLGSRRKTSAWFGDYVSEYNFAESVKDNATVQLYYTKRVSEVELGNEFLNDDFDEIFEENNITMASEERLKNKYAKNYEVIKRPDRLETIAQQIVYHFPRRGFLGKGMVISLDKFTAVRMYDNVTRLWQEEIKWLNTEIKMTIDETIKRNLKDTVDYMRKVEMAVVVSEEQGEEEKFNKEGLTIAPHRRRMNKRDENGDEIEENFKNPDHPLSLVFVCAMWLTGFDAPMVSTLYLDKPMKGHTLMQTIARANRVFPGKENGLIVDFLNVFKYLRQALAEYAPSEDCDEGKMPVKNMELLLDQLNEAIGITLAFFLGLGIDINELITQDDVFKKNELVEDFANIIVDKDDTRYMFKVLSATIANLYDSLRPDIFKMDFDRSYVRAIVFLRDVIENIVKPEVYEKVSMRISRLLDDSVIVDYNSRKYLISDNGKEIDLSKIDIDELSKKFQRIRNKNIEILNIREHIQKKIEQMLKRNITRSDFAERFQRIIDEYNSGGSSNNDYYEKLLQLMRDLKAEEERHVKEELSEAELELFDLLRKDKLTKDEEKLVKLAAKELYRTLLDRTKELFIVGWQNDQQPKERVRSVIHGCLDKTLPTCYDSEIFAEKRELIFGHIVEQAMTGYAWV